MKLRKKPSQVIGHLHPILNVFVDYYNPGKLKSFFSGGGDNSTSTSEEEEPQAILSEGAAQPESTGDTADEVETPAAKVKKAVTPKENTVKLQIKTHFTTIAPMTVEQKRDARSR